LGRITHKERKQKKERKEEKEQKKRSIFFAVLQISNSKAESYTTIRSSSFLLLLSSSSSSTYLLMFESEGEWAGSQRFID
jgi:hypothetical protein